MIIIEAGFFLMGPSIDEEKAEGVPEDWQGFAGRKRPSKISGRFAIGKFPVTRSEFRAFAVSTGFQPVGGCVHFDGTQWHQQAQWRWDNVSFEQTDNHPVVCVSWYDAQRYAKWLSEKTGEEYRLPPEVEWEYSARSGTTQRRYWGDDREHRDQCRFANGADQSYLQLYPSDVTANHVCNDGYAHTSPVGTFSANAFGLYDMLGNVNQWIDDCAPSAELEAATAPECTMRILRGGAWSDPPWAIRAADRYRDLPSTRCMGIGFRVARRVAR